MKRVEKKELEVKVIPMSKETKERLTKVLNEIEGKDLFPEKTEFARKTLYNVKLPI